MNKQVHITRNEVRDLQCKFRADVKFNNVAGQRVMDMTIGEAGIRFADMTTGRDGEFFTTATIIGNGNEQINNAFNTL